MPSPAQPSPATSGRLVDILVVTLMAAALLLAIYLIFFEAPREREMGEVQRIFYFHVASAFAALIGFIACAILSLGFLLLQGRAAWESLASAVDRLARAMGEVGVLFGIIVLVTGPLWAKPAWGVYWTWEPRLMLMLLTVFLFIGYAALRAYAANTEMVRKLAAGVAVVGGPAVYLIHVAVELWGGNHPQVVTGEGGGLQAGAMQTAFAVSVVAMLTFAGALVALRYGQHRHRDELDACWLELSELEGDL